MSRRYHRFGHGHATAVDGLRQITSDRSLSSLPASLQTVIFYQPYGDLVDNPAASWVQ
jgi:hypothetical protein